MNLKNKRKLTFLGIGILMVIIVVFALIYSIGFLIDNINQAMDKKVSGHSDTILKFQVEKAKTLLK